MKSIIFRQPGGAEVLEWVDQPEPVAAPGQVVIRAQAMAVNVPDILIRKGLYKWSPPLPANPGNELAGVIASVGAGVSDFSIGQRVLLSARELPVRGGCYTEKIAVPATSIHVLPDNVDFEQAVVIPTYLVAHAMLNGLGLATHAKSIFVNGVAGAVGSALADLARSQNISVIGSVRSPEKAAFAKSHGVEYVINSASEDVLQKVMSITNGCGVDISFDHVIGPGFLDCLRMLADFGTVVAYNVYSPKPDDDVFEEMRKLSMRSLGLRIFNIHTFDHQQSVLRKLTRELIQLLAQKKINPKIGARFALADAAHAHRLFESGTVLGKVVMTT
ncbi:MAG: quinone oxidoreductase [Betaproteobacteria bacterium]|nr:quinone oxidoreductase [Betaproteobacteria bacterium]